MRKSIGVLTAEEISRLGEQISQEIRSRREMLNRVNSALKDHDDNRTYPIDMSEREYWRD